MAAEEEFLSLCASADNGDIDGVGRFFNDGGGRGRKRRGVLSGGFA